METQHEPVLLTEVIESLQVGPSDVVVDGTLGGGGHFKAILKLLEGEGIIVGIDADPEAVERARVIYADDRRDARPVAHLINDNFRNLTHIIDRLGLSTVNKVLLDLGWSGYQLSEARGFSFQKEEPLLMTYGAEGQTAADIVNTKSEEELADLIYTYGEERFSRPIARAIVAKRAKGRILTTGDLVEAVLAGTPAWYHKRKIHPATKTFQALRVAANDELGALREGLAGALQALAPGGRLAVISFHSIEDRIVKTVLREATHAGHGSLTPKKPITPSRAEILRNRRARSAKLRVFERSARSEAVSGLATNHYLAYV